MEINKFTTNEITDHRVELFLPIQKVDKERRIVTGFATLDNLDKHGDIVTADASRQAFKSFRGNIREMHMPKAVGRMVNFTEKTLHGHQGIFVEVYVSKGAEDTWQKVMDKTLSGFSIGGNIDPDAVEKNEAGGRIIKRYSLNELSLVDSPANQLANVFSIQKVDDGYEFTGFATESTDFDEEEIESVEKADTFESHELVSEGSGVSININAPASTNEEGLAESIAKRIESFLQKTIGGNTMATQTEETAVEEVEDTQTEEVVEAEVDDTVTKAADVSEVEEVEETSVDADENEALVDSVVEKVLERLSKSADANGEVEKAEQPVNDDEAGTEESVTDTDAIAEAITKGVGDALASVTSKIEELNNTVSTLKDETNERLNGLEDVSAVKKSTNTGGNLRKRDAESDFWAESALGGTKTSA